MKETELVLRGSVCQGSFVDGINTVAELKLNKYSIVDCRFLRNCPNDPINGVACEPLLAQQVARNVIELGTSLDGEMDEFTKFVDSNPMPPNGYFDPTIQEPYDGTTDRLAALSNIKNWSAKILGIQEQDAGSLNQEFMWSPSDALTAVYPVLGDSVYDPEGSTWMHSCGTLLSTAQVTHPIHVRGLPLAGSGQVEVEQYPYCSHCEEKPNEYGSPLYEDELDIHELDVLRRMRGDF